MKLSCLILARVILLLSLCSSGMSAEGIPGGDAEAARVDREAAELMFAGKIDESIQLLEGFLSKPGYSNRGYSSVAYTKAEALVAAGRLAEARAFIVECQKRGWNSPAFTLLSGEIDVREWKWKDARIAFRKAFAEEPCLFDDNGDELIALEWGTGQYEKVMEMIAKAMARANEKEPESLNLNHEALYRDVALLLGKPRPRLNSEDEWLDQFSFHDFVGMPDANEAKTLDYCKRLLSFVANERPRLRHLARYRVLFLASQLPAPMRADLIRHLDSIEIPDNESETTKKWLSERLQKK
jgi:hypothetical protein